MLWGALPKHRLRKPLEHASRECPQLPRKGAFKKSPATVSAFLHTCLWGPVVKDRLGPSIIQPPLEDSGPLNCTIQILNSTLLLGIVLLSPTKQIHQTAPSSGAVQVSRVWLRELQQQLLDKCFPYPLSSWTMCPHASKITELQLSLHFLREVDSYKQAYWNKFTPLKVNMFLKILRCSLKYVKAGLTTNGCCNCLWKRNPSLESTLEELQFFSLWRLVIWIP